MGFAELSCIAIEMNCVLRPPLAHWSALTDWCAPAPAFMNVHVITSALSTIQECSQHCGPVDYVYTTLLPSLLKLSSFLTLLCTPTLLFNISVL